MTGEDGRYTEERLPRVIEDTISVFERDVIKLLRGKISQMDKYWDDVATRIERSNEMYIEAMFRLVNKMKNCSERDVKLFNLGMVFAYELLRRQGEAYKLDDSAK